MEELIFALQIVSEILAFCTAVIGFAAVLHDKRKSKKRRRKRR